MYDPIALEALARDLVRSRIEQAAQDALARQLSPAEHSAISLASLISAPADAARHSLAIGLRALAVRLDQPVSTVEPTLGAARPR
jgi:hypothetical protein